MIGAEIFSTYNLCTRPIEKITVQLASIYTLCPHLEALQIAALASVYNLSTVET